MKIENRISKELEDTLKTEISTLGSAILNYVDNNIYVTGFNSKERLFDYLEKNNNCIALKGILPYFEIDFSSISDNARFILQKNGIEFRRYEFIPLKKDTVKYKDDNNIAKSKVYSIRRCSFTNQYSYKDLENSQMFNKIEDLEYYFRNRFGEEFVL